MDDMNIAVWKVSYMERGSSAVHVTTYEGVLTRDEVAEFFGLNRPDIVWYEVVLTGVK